MITYDMIFVPLEVDSISAGASSWVPGFRLGFRAKGVSVLGVQGLGFTGMFRVQGIQVSSTSHRASEFRALHLGWRGRTGVRTSVAENFSIAGLWIGSSLKLGSRFRSPEQ